MTTGFLVSVFWLFSNQGIAGEQQGGNTGRVLQGTSRDLARIDDAGLDQIFVLACCSVVPVPIFVLGHLFTDHSTVDSGVVGDLGQGCAAGANDDVETCGFVFVQAGWLEFERRTKQGHATTWQNPFFNGGTGRVKSVFDASLLFFHFAFGCGTNVQLSNPTRQLGNPFFQFFTIVITGRSSKFPPDLLDSSLDVGRLAESFDDRGVVFVVDVSF